jgi:Protein of unknown function (DUF2865)
MIADRPLRRCALVLATLAACETSAFAQSATCVSLQNQWAALTRKDAGRAGAYANAAQRQIAEMQRVSAYARQIGCDNRRILIFGSDPPAQCGALMARLSRMQANLADLQARMDRSGGGASLDERRYQLQLAIRQNCGGGDPGGLLDQPTDANRLDMPQPMDGSVMSDQGQAMGSGKPICVRLCDGYFFPLASLGNHGNVEAVQMCQAQCPGAETEAFSMGSDDIAQAVGEGGKSYMELENALRYQKATVPGCSCRKTDETWGHALKGAEDMLGGSDTVVNADKAAEMSRPPAAPDLKKGAGAMKGQPSIVGPAPPPDARLSGNGKAPAGQNAASGQAVGPDGTRNVRIIAPPPPTQP